MAKIRQWEDSLYAMTDAEVEEIEHALDVLAQWGLFDREYPEMLQLRSILLNESSRRLMDTVIS